MNNLFFKDINFGKTDALNELIEVGNDYYMASFLEYEKYRIQDFIEGKRYYVLGRKGTGKTALLKYLECKFSNDPENLVIPIRFKSDFDEIDKRDIKKASTDANDEVIEDRYQTQMKSYVIAWQVYLIYQIIKRMYSNIGEYSVFSRTSELDLIWKLLMLIYGEGNKNKLVPKISKGEVVVSVGTHGLDAELQADIEFHNNKLNYEQTAKKIITTYKDLTFNRTPVYILIDELELSVKNKKMREADIVLVRDLILAIDKLNSISKMKGYEIRIYASIRSDVIDSVLTSGYEINKCIEDYGVTIEWYQRGGDYFDSPLLKLLEKKIKASERAKQINGSGNVWTTYFGETINGSDIRRMLLTYSWYRPRDVIRMMHYFQENCKLNTVKITQAVFDRAVLQYSNGMWNEVSEEMSLKFTPDEMKAIKRILTGIKVPFTEKDIISRIAEFIDSYDYVKSFRDKYKVSEFLESLFDWGILGNSGQRMVFNFLGYKDFDITKPMIIHTPLRNFFEVVGK